MIKHSLVIVQILLFFNPELLICGMQQNFPVNNKAVPCENIFIHTDREEYIAGENFWFAAYLFDRQNNNCPGRSNIAYIELLNFDNNPVVQKRIRIDNGFGQGYFQIPDTLSSGSYILRAYTNLMKNFSPEGCFMKNISIYNSFVKSGFRRRSYPGKMSDIDSETKAGSVGPENNSLVGTDTLRHSTPGQFISVHSPDICKKREKITIEIEVDKTFVLQLEKAKLSISVASQGSSSEIMSIYDYMLSGSNSGKWTEEESLHNDFRYKLEENGHFLSGRLISQNQNVSLKDQIVFLSVPGKVAVFQYAITDEEGNFTFLLENDWEQKDMVVQQSGNVNNNLIRIGSPFWDEYLEYQEYGDTIISYMPAHISEWSVNNQIARIYGTVSTGGPGYPTGERTRSARFYGIPDMELIMADYILLPVMQEVFFELIPGVSMRTRRTRYGITVSNPFNNKPYEADATLMVDGVIIYDPAIIIDMNPEIVERIDIVRTEHIVGGYHFYGIVNVITKSGNFNSLLLPENAVRFQHSLFDPEIPFVSPDYSTTEMKNSRIPDFRNTLYWNPSVEPDEEGKARIEFWTSDYISDYIISVQGMTTDGQAISFKKILKIE